MVSNKEDKKKTWLMVVAFIMVACIGVGIGVTFSYYYNRTVDLEKENDRRSDEEKENGDVSQENEDKQNQENKNQIVNISLDSAKQLGYLDLYERIFPYNYYIGSDFIYHNGSFKNVQSMSQEMKLYITACSILDNEDYQQYRNNMGYQLPEAVFKESYIDLFGTDTYNYVEKTSNTCPDYSKTNDGISIHTQCGDTAMPLLFKNVVNVEENSASQELYIYESYAFTKYLGKVGPNNGDLADIYADVSKTALLSSNVEINSAAGHDAENLSKVSGKLPMNKYVFKRKPNSSQGNGHDYYFYSVEKVQ